METRLEKGVCGSCFGKGPPQSKIRYFLKAEKQMFIF